MKRFTLLTLTLLFAVVTFAQKGMLFRPIAKQQPTLKVEGIARQASTPNRKEAKKKAELVNPPSDATTETWYTAGGTFYRYTNSGLVDETDNMEITVAISGSDIYIQGMAYWFKTGWIKGTISGSTAVFPSGQFVGEDSYGSEYLVGSDDFEALTDNITFAYDSKEGVLTSNTKYILENGETDEIAWYCYWDSPVFTKTKPAEPEVVVPPTSLEAEEYAATYLDSDGNEAYGYVNVGFDGSDVYVQGLCAPSLPEAWVKGTLSGSTVTIAGGQFYGKYASTYKLFLQEEDVVFTYDASTHTFSLEGEVTNYTGTQTINYYKNPVIKKVVEVAGTPVNPIISSVEDQGYGDMVLFAIPTVDTEGNPMSSKKLSFQFFSDVEETVSQVTFQPDDYKYLEEAMTVIPYGYSDSYDFYNGTIYLNMEHSTWNKIGIQSIYTGGGKENKSEITWYVIKPYGATTFDFNAMDIATSTVGDSAGDITEEIEIVQEPVTLTVTPSGASTPNRFWKSGKGPQLRVYGGSMTFEVPWNKRIVKIAFDADKWNLENTFDQPTFDGNTKTWTGEAQKVVVTIAGNSQINSITVETEDWVPAEVEVPEGLTTETYSFKAKALENGYDAVTDYAGQVQVGFDGDDAYIQGISVDLPEGWVKATKNADGKYVIPAHQYLGSMEIWGYLFAYYIAAEGTGDDMTDVVLSFDSTKKQFTTSQKVVLHDEDLVPYVTYSDVVITLVPDVAATPVDPSIDAVGFSSYGYPYADFVIPAEGTNGEELLTNKLFYTVWIEKGGEQQVYTFLAGPYYRDFDEDVTEVPYNYDGYDFSTGGGRVYFEEEDAEFTSWSKIGVQSIYYGGGEVHKSKVVWHENGAYTGINDIKANTDTEKAVIYNLTGQRLQRIQKGLNIINGRKFVIK